MGCRTARPKKEMIRIVRDPDGNLHVDATGKRSGRGAYICPTRSCFDAAVDGQRLSRALERPLTDDVVQALKESLSALSHDE